MTGNLDDPKFDYSEIIGKAIGNLISGIFAAPFKLLAALFSGINHEEFSNIGFDPGSARLLPPEREKLGKIVQALAKRPELKLLVPARYDIELDARALKRAALRLELAKRAGLDIEAESCPRRGRRAHARVVEAVIREARPGVASRAADLPKDLPAELLLLRGMNDHGNPPEYEKEIHEAVPGSQYIKLPDAGHFPNAENPAVFNALLGDFLRRLPR